MNWRKAGSGYAGFWTGAFHWACFMEFLNYCRDQVHKPKDIKEACITFLWTTLNTAREYITFEEN